MLIFNFFTIQSEKFSEILNAPLTLITNIDISVGLFLCKIVKIQLDPVKLARFFDNFSLWRFLANFSETDQPNQMPFGSYMAVANVHKSAKGRTIPFIRCLAISHEIRWGIEPFVRNWQKPSQRAVFLLKVRCFHVSYLSSGWTESRALWHTYGHLRRPYMSQTAFGSAEPFARNWRRTDTTKSG